MIDTKRLRALDHLAPGKLSTDANRILYQDGDEIAKCRYAVGSNGETIAATDIAELLTESRNALPDLLAIAEAIQPDALETAIRAIGESEHATEARYLEAEKALKRLRRAAEMLEGTPDSDPVELHIGFGGWGGKGIARPEEIPSLQEARKTKAIIYKSWMLRGWTFSGSIQVTAIQPNGEYEFVGIGKDLKKVSPGGEIDMVYDEKRTGSVEFTP